MAKESNLGKTEIEGEEKPDAEQKKGKVHGAAEPAVQEADEILEHGAARFYGFCFCFRPPNSASRMTPYSAFCSMTPPNASAFRPRA